MEKEAQIEVAKMRSLMERIEKPQTNYEATLNEEQYINEARNNVQMVTRDDIKNILEDQDEKGNGGLYATIVYASAAKIYKTKRAGGWDSNKVGSMLSAMKDSHGETEWHKALTAYNEPTVKPSAKNPVAVMYVTKYQLHWTTKENYDKAYNEYADGLHNLRMKLGVGLDSNGMLGDDKNQRSKMDGGTQLNVNGNPSKDFNMVGSKILDAKIYFVNAEGHVVEELPEEAFKAMARKATSNAPEKAVSDVASPEEIKAYMEAKAKLAEKFNGRTLNYDGMLAIAANVNGQAYAYVNDAGKLSGKDAFLVNPEELFQIGEKEIGVQGKIMDTFAQP